MQNNSNSISAINTNQINAEKLIDYGEQFLTKSIETMLVNPDFFSQFKSYFKKEYFDGSFAHKKLLEVIYYHYDKHNEIPTIDILETHNNLNTDEISKRNIFKILEQIKTNMSARYSSEHYSFYINELKKFRKHQIIKDTLKESIKLLEVNEFKKIEALLHKGVEDIDIDFSIYDYIEEFDNRIQPTSRNSVPTLWKEVDKVLENSGPASGEIYILQGDIGLGKSFMLCQIGVNALIQGKNVLYISAETRKRTLALRFDSLISSIPLDDILLNKDKVRDELRNFFNKGQRLIIEEYPSGGVTIPEIYSKIKQIKKKIPKIDLIIIDYLDILDLSIYDGQEWQKLKAVYEAGRKLASDFDVPVWSATHPNTEGIKSEGYVTYDKTYGGPNKFKNVDFVITLKKSEGRIVGYIAKNRVGANGIFLDVELDTYKPSIFIGDVCSTSPIDGPDLEKESLRRMLKDLNVIR